ncbi:hypothetical protein [Granulicella mallensis]|uniref:hypothetical protein n=1 Tax=Granulicella mallensis TaxID=940614 RepID=UPI0012378BCC|nr:hypothetical protein [Granulicella mallensis]
MVSAIVLSLAAAMLCLMACLSVLGTVMAQHMPVTVEAPGMASQPGFLLGVMIFAILFYLALAAWAITTVVGLFRMRNWARISIMIIGGGLAAIGLFSTLVSVAMPTMMKSMPPTPGADPAVMRIVFFVFAALWLFIAAIGLWWLVYFALRNTREAFAQAKAQRGLLMTDAGMAAAYPAPAYPPPTSPLTDFTVARPLPQEPLQAPLTAPAEMYPQPIVAAPLQPVVPARPVSITIIAVLLLLGLGVTLIATLLPFPAFLFGVILSGWTSHVMYLVFACLSGVAGIGLLKLQKPAWVLTFALYVVGLLNVVSLLLPNVRQRLLDYQQILAHTMGMPTPVFSPGPAFMNFSLLLGVAFDVLILATLMVLLWRARWAFEPKAARSNDHAAA